MWENMNEVDEEVEIKEFSDLPKLNNVYLVESENEYHNWIMRKSAQVYNLTYEELPLTNHTFQKLRIYGIMEVPSIYYIDISSETLSGKLINQIKSIQLRNRIICLGIKNTKYVQKYMTLKNTKTGKLPLLVKDYEEWLDKFYFCDSYVIPRDVSFESNDVKETLIRLMIRNPEYWYTVSLLDKSFSLTYEITLDDLNTIFPDIDFYSLDEWIRLTLIGKTAKKHIQMYDYFTTVKQYNHMWLLNKLRERYINLSYVYEAYRSGIIFNNYYQNFEERADSVGFQFTTEFKSLNNRERRECFMIIEDMPFRYYVFLQELLFEKEILTDNEILVLLNEIKKVRDLYEKYDGKGSKVFKRKKYRK